MDLFKPTAGKRLAFFLIADTIIFTFSLYLSLLFRFNFDIPATYITRFLYWFVAIDILKITALWLVDIYKLNWRFVSVNEFYKIVKALFWTFVITYFTNVAMQKLNIPFSLPRSSIVIDFFVSTMLVLILRAARRVYLEILKPKNEQGKKRALIIGGGYTGERIIREMKRGGSKYLPVSILDDEPSKQGTLIHQVRVDGKLSDLEKIIKEKNIEAAIIAITTLHHSKTRELFDRLTRVGIKDIKIVPPLEHLPSTDLSIKDLKEISIEDLLAREMANIDKNQVQRLIEGKKILITGAGGSIGSEIVRQALKFNPECIVGYEIDETELHNLQMELMDKRFKPVVGDIKNREKLDSLFDKEKPEIVFHAAAYKHVPMMELFPEEAFKTNVLGTLNLVELSIKHAVGRFVNISTDKAVNPKNVMGATKRVAEMICAAYDKISDTRFISVRFGNVLGSRGSVIPLFIEQIKKGGPVTVTHPEMRRYFMSIPEAVLLVLQAAALGKGGEVFVLDMGEPVKIVELAERLIKLEGFEPYKDIDIVFTGIRPGEKLFEELLMAEEGSKYTTHPKIYSVRISHTPNTQEILNFIKRFTRLNPEQLRKELIQLSKMK